MSIGLETGLGDLEFAVHEERIDVIHSIRNGIQTAQRLTVVELLMIAVLVGLVVAIAIPAYQSLP